MGITRKRAVWVKCSGEAHSNPMIDHCMICMPYWEFVPLCPKCLKKLRQGRKVLACPSCGKRYVMEYGKGCYGDGFNEWSYNEWKKKKALEKIEVT